MNGKSYPLHQPGMNEAFSATTIKEGFDFQSFNDNSSYSDFERDSRAPTVARVGDQAATETLLSLIFLPQQTFAKCPFF